MIGWLGDHVISHLKLGVVVGEELAESLGGHHHEGLHLLPHGPEGGFAVLGEGSGDKVVR